MSPSELKQINIRLENIFGKELDGRPRLRLVWSNTQFEHRVGVFNIHTQSGIFLHTEQGAREMPKYGYAKDRWILEFAYNQARPDLLKSESYEPLWIFQDRDGNALVPIWRAVEMIAYAWQNPNPIKSLWEKEQDEVKKKKKEEDYYFDIIQNNSPYLATMMHNREAVFLDSTKQDKVEDKKDEVHTS